MTRRLTDGAEVYVRSIRPDDKLLLQSALQNLSELSIQRRFLGPKKRFTQSELRYLTELDRHNHVALVAESPVQFSRHFVGVARFVRLPDDPATAEAAIAVADSWQGRGVGSMLARELGGRARGLGIKRFTAMIASDNEPAHRLMAKLTAQLEERPAGHGVSEAVLDLAA